MFDISWTEILVIGVVALIAIGPKELPRVLYELGKAVRRLRAMAGEFQRHVNDMMHETELDELRRQADNFIELQELSPVIARVHHHRESLQNDSPSSAAYDHA